jgi:Zn-dependent peptidase ImmA (M78 family)
MTVRIERMAEKLLHESNAYRVPVPIDAVVTHLNLRMTSVGLDDDLSGVLVVDKKQGVIGFNASHPSVRQRFTIAHEVGHYLLHAKDAPSRLFIDRSVFRRSDESAKGNDREEVEANAFAAALLMPEALVRQEIDKHRFDLDDEDAVAALARQFNVSPSAMSYRLVNLRLVRFGPASRSADRS